MGVKKAESQRKTAAERAQEQLDTADRVIARLVKRVEAAKADVVTLEDELEAARARRDYLAQNPALLPERRVDTPIPGVDSPDPAGSTEEG
jgi:hypothetical protein